MLFIIWYYLNFPGASAFSLFFLIVASYFIIKLLSTTFGKLILGSGNFSQIRTLLAGIFFVFFWIAILLSFFILSITYISVNTELGRIVYFDNLFMSFDKYVFGMYLPFWMQNVHNPFYSIFSLISPIVLGVYIILGFALATAFCFLLIKNYVNFYKMLLAFSLTILISLPLWYLFPAVSPLDAYFNKNINSPVPAPIQAYIKDYKPNYYLAGFFISMNDLYKNNKENFFPITTMPSMHIAWSFLILYFCCKTKKRLMYLLVPYFILNMVATLYMLQHYTIDIAGGLLVSIICIWLAQKISGAKTPRLISELSMQINKDMKWMLS